ncbi:MAG TPA: phosphoribosylamine--glycine ligase [Bryobacteraceae bacterium]|nr:phosphoribosylamine--glycine ligase [Bryobacteraceae bacterium]
MKILIVGGGGREHALAWKLSRSPLVKGLVASPGNPGIAQVAQCLPAPAEISGYATIATEFGCDLTIVGPEAPLVAGIVDEFYRRRLKIIGPTQAAARLEGSKLFAKEFFKRAGIPTARSGTNLDEFGFPVVIKADGLAAGKGVVIAHDRSEAEQAIQRLGPAVFVEEFLEGEEVSFMGLSNGHMLLPFAPTQDHKRVFDGDQGPNTGGMGAYCAPGILSAQQSGEVMERIMLPTIHRMRQEGTPFVGFLYAGLMMTATGPKVLEFNVRLGDPETQVLMHSFRGDFAEVINMMATGVGSIGGRAWANNSVCVVLAAAGYPEAARTGDKIQGVGEAEALGAKVFQAGTKLVDGELATSGGRVLGVTAGGDSLPAAIEKAYLAVDQIRFEGMQYRKDIGHKGLQRLRAGGE